MIRVHIIGEGQTEVSFVHQVLAPTFYSRGISLTSSRLGISGHKGGRPNYARYKKDVRIQLSQESRVYCSTMIDLYGLGTGFPGDESGLTGIRKVVQIEEAIKADICKEFPRLRPDTRFLPYIQPHEFEGLLFSAPSRFAEALDRPDLSMEFQAIRDQFETPEDINDSAETAPSKRVRRACGVYRKVLQGTRAAQTVGLSTMRKECPHFRAWLEQIERLAHQV